MNTMRNSLTPNFQPPTSYAGCPCFLFREPCSENWYVDQRRTGWDAMFTFSGKERDQETGYGYFGARYYDSDLSIWLSVDPMAHLYPHQTPYAYCSNNPINRIDPDGMLDSDHVDKFGNIIASYDDGDNGVYQHVDGTTKSDIDQQRATNNYTGGNGKKIGELGKDINMSEIFTNKLSQSAEKAKDMGIVDYYNAVKTKGNWDLKNNKNTIWGVAWEYDKNNETKTTFFSNGRFYGASAADVGNYHAGYTGAFAGISNYILWKGAGAAETYKSFSNGNIGDGLKRGYMLINPFSKRSGDQIQDWIYNTKGMNEANYRMNK